MGRSLREENQISDLKPYMQSVLIVLGFSIWQFAYKSDAGRDGGQEEKGMTEDKMAGSHHQLDGHEFEWTPRVGDGQEAWRAVIHGVSKSLTQLSNWTELN